ncbi:hypothetical protein BBJ28_00016445 [Nothophytophthora sp. Chile5]|nr:hypothetical protein BBJ28_00016445 [Nothophytophthora sp. Chile5]
MFLFVRAAVGYSLAFVKAKSLEKELLRILQDQKRCRIDKAKQTKDEANQQQQQCVEVAERRERIAHALETQASCARAMSATYARLVLHCSNYENHKEDEHFFECVYFFVCSVVKLGVAANYWRPLEEELGFLFRGAQFSANVKLHTASAYRDAEAVGGTMTESADSSASGFSSSATRSGAGGVTGSGPNGSNGAGNSSGNNGNAGSTGAKKMQSLSTAIAKDVATHRTATGDSAAFQLPKSRVSHFAPSVPARRIVSELEATKARASRNMELSQALRDRIRVQRNEDRRRQVEALMSPRHTVELDLLDSDVADGSVAASARSHGLLSPRISMKNTFTTRSPALNHLLPTAEERVRLALQCVCCWFEREPMSCS